MAESSIEKVSTEKRVFKIFPPEGLDLPLKSFEEYQDLYRKSIEDPEGFWAGMAEDFEWIRKWKKVRDHSWGEKIEVKWFEGAKSNITANALDRHLEKRGDQAALIWEGNDAAEIRRFTYRELHAEVCRLANGLKSLGVKKGDRVAVYMGMVPELAMSLLACARIGAVHNVIFGGFSVDSIKDRILDARAEFVITADGLYRGAKTVSLKTNVDKALAACSKENHHVKKCLVLKRTNEKVDWDQDRDVWWEELVPNQAAQCEPEPMDAEDLLFMLYTSGSTGKPKGVLHTSAGYMVWAAVTFRYVFTYQPGETFWCTADIGWVTGHTYLVYGPLLNGATTMMFEGIPTHPNPDRFWDIVERHKVNIFYTAPTAIRSLMRQGEKWVEAHDLSSLRILGTVGEPINPETWIWYFEKVGGKRCPVVDTWWQTETGGIMVSPLPYVTPLKPGSATLPFFGVEPKIVKEDGTECKTDEGGSFCIAQPWPAMIRGVYGQPDRVKETYFKKFPIYLAGDSALRDKDGYYWFLGRMDDVLKVSGHRLGTAELESAFVKNANVVEAAVVGFPHPVKGEGIYAFLTLKEGIQPSRNLRRELVQFIATEIGPIAKPDHILFTDLLPKTRSGKIMRRILKKIAAGEVENLGDTTTLADPSVVDRIVEKSHEEDV